MRHSGTSRSRPQLRCGAIKVICRRTSRYDGGAQVGVTRTRSEKRRNAMYASARTCAFRENLATFRRHVRGGCRTARLARLRGKPIDDRSRSLPDQSSGSLTAVDGISLAVEKGEVLGFLGPNGAGKTTTMRMIAGYLEPSAGAARVCDFDLVVSRSRQSGG